VKPGSLFSVFFGTSMVFNPFRKKEVAPMPAPTIKKVVLEGVATPPVLPKPEMPTQDPFISRLHASGRHQDFNPSESVRVSKMSCPSCQASFRIFLNADGKKTVVKCPGCAKYYKV
jgi:predicted Zn finger-like uncharacterized protein